MTGVETVPDEAPAVKRPAPGWRRWTAIAAVAAVVAALGWFGWWLRHPAPLGWGQHGVSVDQQIEEAMWFGVSYPANEPAERRVLGIESVRPKVVQGEADVDYYVCRIDPVEAQRDKVGALGTGLSDRYVERFCSELLPAEGATMDLVAEPRQQLVVRVVQTGPGRLVIAGHDLTYREGWQTGAERVWPRIVTRG